MIHPSFVGPSRPYTRPSNGHYSIPSPPSKKGEFPSLHLLANTCWFSFKGNLSSLDTFSHFFPGGETKLKNMRRHKTGKHGHGRIRPSAAEGVGASGRRRGLRALRLLHRGPGDGHPGAEATSMSFFAKNPKRRSKNIGLPLKNTTFQLFG